VCVAHVSSRRHSPTELAPWSYAGFNGACARARTPPLPQRRLTTTATGTYFLSPTEPLFQTIGAKYIAVQTALWGTDHYYSADPFNEASPPSTAPAFLAEVGATIYKSMSTSDPDAIWVMQVGRVCA
jgi:alpha-N-acetylglucosaminidase